MKFNCTLLRFTTALAVTGLSQFALAANVQFSGVNETEYRFFLQDGAYAQQEKAAISLAITPEIYKEFDDGINSVWFKPFARLDQHDAERTHIDIREFMWLHLGDGWESRVGIGKVFWGQTESLHLVDIINQTDAVESVDGEDKLGQPMANLNYYTDNGTLSLYVLPYFRERNFVGPEGRLRPPVAILSDQALYESSSEQTNLDYAIRWQGSLGDWEVGLAYFDGTSREPELMPSFNQQMELELRPYYAQISQLGVDVLKVQDAWLLKFEGIQRKGQSEDFFAAVGGIEYTQIGVFDTIYDLGWLVEYQYDERENNFFAIGQNDLMLGLRLTLNDFDSSELLAGWVQDLDNTDTYSLFFEGSTRIGRHWKVSAEGYFFSSDQPTDMFYIVRRDDHIRIALEYYF